MTSVTRRLAVILAMVLVPVVALAQEATLTGTITDSTGGVLPGAVVVAVHEATGNTFQAVSDERGGFRVPVRVGEFTISVELSGFTAPGRRVQLLVGQTAVLDIQMSPATLQETVTVTSETPLIEVTQSNLGGNIDPLQMQ